MAQIKLGNLLWRSHTRPISPEDPVDVKDVNAADIKTKLEMVQSELALVKAELQTIKTNQLSGDQKVTLKDASGAVVSPATEAKLEQVRALLSGVATENKLEQARALLAAISGKDFATQTTLAAVLAKLADLESELATIKANQLSGDQKVQLSGTIVEIGLLADRPTATPENKGMGYFAWDAPEGNKLTYSDGTKWVVN
jgi:chromosome segregation ATPase